MPIDPARLNAVGDLIEPRELRALADPLRLKLFDLVRRHGPITTLELAGLTEQDRASVEGHLRELESVGLVERAVADGGEQAWTTSVKGICFEIPDEPKAQQAARELSNVMLAKYADVPTAWVREEEPKLELEWARAAGLFNARVDLTAEELRGIRSTSSGCWSRSLRVRPRMRRRAPGRCGFSRTSCRRLCETRERSA
jgi:DNA-binding transcriptional ArsR family regulator